MLFACSGTPEVKEQTAEQKHTKPLSTFFEKEKVTGTFVLYDLKADQYIIHNEERANIAFSPASTFKIANSLIVLETGAIKDDAEIIPWDGVERTFKFWNKDHNLRSAYKYSAVWFYQDLARKVGKGRMKFWVRKAKYGNQETGEKIDKFWLTGDLRITAMQQIDFLKRLHQEDLEFSKRNIKLVKDIMIEEQTENYALRSKTGWGTLSIPAIGWYVGYIEKKDNTYFFALNIDMQDDADVGKRKSIAREILQEYKIL